MMTNHSRLLDFLGRAMLAAILVASYAPVFMVILYSFNSSKLGTVWGGFTTKWYFELWQRDDLWDGLRMSLSVGVLSSTLAVALAALAAWGVFHFRSAVTKGIAQGMLAIPLILPDVILGVSLAIAFHLAGLSRGTVS